jgi:hypothetical protein
MSVKKRVVVDRPCVEPGVTFEERENGRFCLSCREMQHDLTNATRREALALIDANGGRICGTFRVGPSGEVRFRPEAPARSANAARGAALALALAGCGSPSETTATPTTTVAAPPSSAPPIESTTTSLPIDPDTTDHSTDASSDATEHEGHAHTHAPVLVGMGSGRSMQVSGGATAMPHDHDEAARALITADYGGIETSGDGTLDRAIIVRLLHSRQAAVQTCYGHELLANPTLAGRLTLEVEVDPSGGVRSAHAVVNTVGSEEVAACACAAMRSLRFPSPDGGAVRFTVDYTLRPFSS